MDKSKKSCLEKYGVEYAMQNDNIYLKNIHYYQVNYK